MFWKLASAQHCWFHGKTWHTYSAANLWETYWPQVTQLWRHCPWLSLPLLPAVLALIFWRWELLEMLSHYPQKLSSTVLTLHAALPRLAGINPKLLLRGSSRPSPPRACCLGHALGRSKSSTWPHVEREVEALGLRPALPAVGRLRRENMRELIAKCLGTGLMSHV